MKKLMIAAAIVCAAVVTQAAQWKWTTNGSVLSDTAGKAYASATVYMIEAVGCTGPTDKTTQNAWLDLYQNEATRASAVSALSSSAFKIGNTDEYGKMADITWTDSTAAGLTKYFYMVAIDDDGAYITMSGKVTTQDDTKLSTYGGTFAPSVNIQDATGKAEFNLPGWYKVEAVPEPTSGLLLLLGVAGLALRRRRA